MATANRNIVKYDPSVNLAQGLDDNAQKSLFMFINK